MRYGFALLIILLLATLQASAYYDFNPELRLAHEKIIGLRLQEGKDILNKERKNHPGNLLSILFENYIDFLIAFITEEEEHFRNFKKNSAARVDQLTKFSNEGASAYHLYSIAEMTLQDAMLKIKFQENISAATEIRKAYKLIEKNQKIYPTFLMNKKLSGFIHTLVGSVPREYRWITDLVGMKGTVSGGTSELKSLFHLIEGNGIYKGYQAELLFYLSNIHNTFSGDKAEGEELLTLMKSYTEANPLIRYCYANTAMKWGRNDEAIEILESKESDKGTFPFYYINYKKGISMLRKLDPQAEKEFRYFIDNFGGMNHRKSNYQKLAWVKLLNADIPAYHSFMKLCLESGNTQADEDKEAFKEASTGEIPNVILLRARLLFDGGYYKESWSEIAGKPVDSFPRYRDKLEMTYRLGRIMEKLEQREKAIHYYSQTLKNGASSKYYFAANSALLLGILFEQEGDLGRAASYYKQCLELRGHDYQNSIDQKAQAGLDRIADMEKGKGR